MDLRASSLMSFVPWVVMAVGSSAAGLLADGLVSAAGARIARPSAGIRRWLLRATGGQPSSLRQLAAPHSPARPARLACLAASGAARRAGAARAQGHPDSGLPRPGGGAHGAGKPRHLAAPGPALHDGSAGHHFPGCAPPPAWGHPLPVGPLAMPEYLDRTPQPWCISLAAQSSKCACAALE